MICRLCLHDLMKENAILLYDDSGNIVETQLVKSIAKYLQLELLPDDAISTNICQDCSEHLEDFHRYWLLVDQKQSTLRNNVFLKVECDLQPPSESAGVEEVFGQNDEEPLMDFKRLLPEQMACAETSVDMTATETVSLFPMTRIKSETRLEEDTCDAAIDSTDDDMPLQNLLDKFKAKSAKSTRRMRTKTKAKKKKKTATETAKSEYSQKFHTSKVNEDIISDFMQLHCDICKASAENYSDLRKHFRSVHKSNPYVRCCKYVFHKPNKLVDHINWHRNPDSLKCDICHKQLRTSKCLQVHKEGRHGKAAKERALQQCPVCNKSFRGSKCLEKHIQRHNNPDEEKSHSCELCEKSFLTVQRLRRHVESIHENIYHHICDICGKKFKFKPSFERHVLEHQGITDPPEQCQICGKWLKNKHALRLHRFNHDSNAKCNICGRICPTRTALRGHIRYTHLLEQNLQCSYCDKSFKVAKNLQEHMAIHTGAQLYSCPHCSKECRSKSNMYVHIKRAHMQEWLKSQMARSNDPRFKIDATIGDDSSLQHS